MNAEDKRLYFKTYHFPQRVERVRARINQLQQEANNLGLVDMSRTLDAVDRAFDREVELEQLRARERGQEWSMGVDHA